MQDSPLHALHAARGARLSPAGEADPLLTYGDVPGEYAAAQEGVALFDESDRGLVMARGADAPAFLHRLLANDVRGLLPGSGNANLLLSPKGKIRFAFDLSRAEEAVELSCPPGQDEALLQALDQYLFSEAVELSRKSERHAPLSVLGPRAPELLRGLLGSSPPGVDHEWKDMRGGGGPVRVQALVLHGSRAWRLDAGAQGVLGLWTALCEAGARPAGRVVADILRVEAGAARPGDDVDESVYPQEARLEGSFSLDKGCYIGQEVVAKIDTYGGLNKRLVALAVSHDDPVPRGTRLYRQESVGEEWRDLGVVTSWAYSFVRDTGLVLAYVKRRHQAVGTRFRVGDGPGEAEVVPLPVRAGAVEVTGGFE
jgi:aminomethyltransferase